MRIISGTHGGRKITPPAKMPFTRPTTDIAKEGLFNIIQNSLDIPTLNILDLFGGTGSISFEFASRGAQRITIVEKDSAMLSFIEKSIDSFAFENITVIRSEVFRFIESCKEQFDFIFAGPPYALTTIDLLPEKVFKYDLLSNGGWFVLEHTPRNNYKTFPYYKNERNYGTTIFSFFLKEDK